MPEQSARSRILARARAASSRPLGRGGAGLSANPAAQPAACGLVALARRHRAASGSLRDAALELVQRAVALRPDGAVYRNNSGPNPRALGARRRSRRWPTRRRSRSIPSYAEACNNLGHLLQRRDRLAEAEALFRKAIELDPRLRGAAHQSRQPAQGSRRPRRGDRVVPARGRAAAGSVVAAQQSACWRCTTIPATRRPISRASIGSGPSGTWRRSSRRAGRTATAAIRTAGCASATCRPIFASMPSRASCCRCSSEHDRAQVEVFAYSDVTRPDAVTDAGPRPRGSMARRHALSDEQLAGRRARRRDRHPRGSRGAFRRTTGCSCSRASRRRCRSRISRTAARRASTRSTIE